MRSGTDAQCNLTRRANHRHIFIVANPAGGSLAGFLLSAHPLGVLAAIRQLFAGVDELSVLALLQRDSVVVDLFQKDGVFDWGNRNTSMGGGVISEAICV
jgi:hypothetical protein